MGGMKEGYGRKEGEGKMEGNIPNEVVPRGSVIF